MADRQGPSILAVAFASAIVAGLAGYFLGQASSIGVFSSGASKPNHKSKASSSSSFAGEKVDQSDSDISDAGAATDDDDDSDDDDLDDQELDGFKDSNEECKLVLVVRTDLGMTKGKLCLLFPACLVATGPLSVLGPAWGVGGLFHFRFVDPILTMCISQAR